MLRHTVVIFAAVLFAVASSIAGECPTVHLSNGTTVDLSGLDSTNFAFGNSNASGAVPQLFQQSGELGTGPTLWTFSLCAPFSLETAPYKSGCQNSFAGQGAGDVMSFSAVCNAKTFLSMLEPPRAVGSNPHQQYLTATYATAGNTSKIFVNMHCTTEAGAPLLNFTRAYSWELAENGTITAATFSAYSSKFCASSLATTTTVASTTAAPPSSSPSSPASTTSAAPSSSPPTTTTAAVCSSPNVYVAPVPNKTFAPYVASDSFVYPFADAVVATPLTGNRPSVTVTIVAFIEHGYSHDVDQLALPQSMPLQQQWVHGRGVLRITTNASVYNVSLTDIVRSIMFVTTSHSTATRRVGWMLLKVSEFESTLSSTPPPPTAPHRADFADLTAKVVAFFPPNNVISRDDARQVCVERSAPNTTAGTLLSIESQSDFLAANQRLVGFGWTAGLAQTVVSPTQQVWKWGESGSALQFWVGESFSHGGTSYGEYSNWQPATITPPFSAGEPSVYPSKLSALFVEVTGFWFARPPDTSANVQSYLCENVVKDFSSSNNNQSGGSFFGLVDIPRSGCFNPDPAAAVAEGCGQRGSSQESCTSSPECYYDSVRSVCVASCGLLVPDLESCARSALGCRIEQSSLPVKCVQDACRLRSNGTDCTSQPECAVVDGVCVLNRNCSSLGQQQCSMNAPLCNWNSVLGVCDFSVNCSDFNNNQLVHPCSEDFCKWRCQSASPTCAIVGGVCVRSGATTTSTAAPPTSSTASPPTTTTPAPPSPTPPANLSCADVHLPNGSVVVLSHLNSHNFAFGNKGKDGAATIFQQSSSQGTGGPFPWAFSLCERFNEYTSPQGSMCQNMFVGAASRGTSTLSNLCSDSVQRFSRMTQQPTAVGSDPDQQYLTMTFADSGGDHLVHVELHCVFAEPSSVLTFNMSYSLEVVPHATTAAFFKAYSPEFCANLSSSSSTSASTSTSTTISPITSTTATTTSSPSTTRRCADVHLPNGSTIFLSGLNSSNFAFGNTGSTPVVFNWTGASTGRLPWAFSPCAPFSSTTKPPSSACDGAYVGYGADPISPFSFFCRASSDNYMNTMLQAPAFSDGNEDYLKAVYAPPASSVNNDKAILHMFCTPTGSDALSFDLDNTYDGEFFYTFKAFSRRFCAFPQAAAPAATTTTASPSSSSSAASPPTSSSSTTVIIAAAAGAGGFILLVAFLVFFFFTRRKKAARAASRGHNVAGWDDRSLLSRTSLSSDDGAQSDAGQPPSSTFSSPGGGGGISGSGIPIPRAPGLNGSGSDSDDASAVPSALGLSQPTLAGGHNNKSLASLQQQQDDAEDVTNIHSTAAPRITVPRDYAAPASGDLASALKNNKFLRARFKHLDSIVAGAFAVARDTEKKQHQRDLKHPPLDLDECFTLALYSFDIGTGVPEDNFYFALNHALRHRDAAGSKELVEALTPYFLVFDKAWAKLPPQKRRVFRGIPMTKSVDTVRREMQAGRVLSWYAVTSASTDEKVADQFGSGTEQGIMFVVSTVDARSIAEYSAIPTENELVLPPGTQLMVIPPPAGYIERVNKNTLVVFAQQMQPESNPFTDAEKV